MFCKQTRPLSLSRYRFFFAVLLLCSMVYPTLFTPTPLQAQEVTDDEIVYIDGNGFIRVIDPRLSGDVLIDWQSDEGGFIDFALGDFNADGDMEIAAIGGAGGTGKLVVYDPVVSDRRITPSGITPNGVPWRKLYTEQIGFTPLYVGAGNLDDGIPGDEILFGYEVAFNRSELRVIKGASTAPTGINWLQHIPSTGRGLAFLRSWDFVTIGQIDGVGTDEVILIDNTVVVDDSKSEINFYRVDDGGLDNASPFFKQNSSKNKWRYAAIGEVTNGGTQEVVALRSTSGNGPANTIIYRYFGGRDPQIQEGSDDDLLFFNPRASRVILADITGPVDGISDKEIFLLRTVKNDPEGIRMIIRNRGNDKITSDKEHKLDADNGYQYGAAGDLDADGKDEVIIMRPNRVRVYNDPNSNMNNTTEFDVANNGKSIKAGDLDKNGTASGLEFEVDVSALENEIAAGSREVLIIPMTTGEQRVDFTAQLNDSPEWITEFTPASGTTPRSLSLTVDARKLSPGTYSTSITVRTNNPDIVNNPLVIPVNLTVVPASLEIQPASASVVESSCTDSAETQSVELAIKGTSGISYTAVVLDIPSVTVAQQLLEGEINSASLTKDGTLELRDWRGNVSVLQTLPQLDTAVRAAQANSAQIEWTSQVPWVSASSETGNTPDVMTVLVASPTSGDGTTRLASDTYNEALIILVADPRAGKTPDNVRFITVSHLCAVSQISLPLINSTNQVSAASPE